MGRPRGVSAPVEVEDGVKDEPEVEDGDDDEAPAGGKVSKSRAIQAGIDEGLRNIDELMKFAKARYGVDVAKGHVSAIKSTYLKKLGTGETRSRGVSGLSAGPGIPSSFTADMKELRGLIDKVGGIGEMRDLVDDLGGLLEKYGKAGLVDLMDAIG